MARVLRVFVLVVLAANVFAQTLPEAPRPSKLRKVDRVLEVLAVASIGTDAYATHLDWSVPPGVGKTEVNPIARLFVSHGTAPLVAYFAAGAGAFVFAHHELGHRHRKLALLLDLAVLGSETYYTQYSFRHHIE